MEANGRGDRHHAGRVGALGSLSESAFKMFCDLTRTNLRLQWRQQEAGSAELQIADHCPSASLNLWVGASA